jgi:hypothetical protein
VPLDGPRGFVNPGDGIFVLAEIRVGDLSGFKQGGMHIAG